VASRTLSEPLEWGNSTLLQGDAADAVAALKEQDGGDLLLIGSAALTHALIEHGLIDEFRIMIDPSWWEAARACFPTTACSGRCASSTAR